MKQQTYVIEINRDRRFINGGENYDFFRVGCKRVSTCLKYIKAWTQQATEGRGLNVLYQRVFCIEGANYIIKDNNDNTVASGLICEL